MENENRNGQQPDDEQKIINAGAPEEGQDAGTEILEEPANETTKEAAAETTETTDAGQKLEKDGFNWKKELLDWLVAICCAVAITLVINTCFFTIVNIDGPSMQPTINGGDKIFVQKIGYQPKMGDVIVFRPESDPDKHYIKRVIATEGQKVEIDYAANKVFVDGRLIPEDYILQDTEDILEPTKYESWDFGRVPEGHCFVMGDNRNNSRDSRDPQVGYVSYDSVDGKALFRFFPFTQMKVIESNPYVADLFE